MGKVVVIGSSNTDMVVSVEQLSKPGETILGHNLSVHQGGKGANQAVAAARAGAQVSFIAKVGDDEYGKKAIQAYQREGIDTSQILVDKQLSTGLAFISVEKLSGENSIVVVSGANEGLFPSDLEELEGLIQSASILLIQLEIRIETVKAALTLAKKYGVQTILNPAPAVSLNSEILELVDILIPNEVEAELLTNTLLVDDESRKKVVAKLVNQVNEAVVLTMGSKGVLYMMKNKKAKYINAHQVTAIDTTAAGDVFCGYLASCLADEVPFQRALELSISASAIAVTRHGAQSSIPFINELGFIKNELDNFCNLRVE